MAQMSENAQKRFELGIAIEQDGTVTKVLHTADRYVDKDIEVKVVTPDATFEAKEIGDLTAAASSESAYLTDTETAFPVELKATANMGAVKVGVKDAGFAAADDTITVPAQDEVVETTTKYIKAGALADVTNSAEAVSTSIALSNAAEGDKFTITVNAEGTAAVATSGWIEAGTEKEFSSSKTYKLPEVTFANKLADGVADDYEEITAIGGAPALISGGYLYIKEGYITNTKISLKTLVPDEATIVAGDSPFILQGISAYDKDGTLITGSMATLTGDNIAITADDAAVNIASVTPAYNEENSNFDITGSGDITGTATAKVTATGYIVEDTEAAQDIEGTATVNATLDVVSLGAEKAEDGAVTPEILKGTGTALSGAIATTAPTGHYVEIHTDAIEASTVVSPKVSAAGYGTADHFNKTDITVARGAEASGSYYIEITDGDVVSELGEATNNAPVVVVSTEATASDDSISLDGILDAAPSEGKYITLGASTDEVTGVVKQSITTTVTEGYVTADKTNTQTVNQTVTVAAAENAQYIRVYEGLYD